MSRAPFILAALSGLCLAALASAPASAADPSPWPWLSSSKHEPASLSVVPRIREVTVAESENSHGLRLKIDVSGEANVAGWEDVHLVPLFYPAAGMGWPTDKVYDFVLYGHESGGMAAQMISKVTADASYPLSVSGSVVGVRIHGTENCMYVGVTSQDPSLARGCKLLK